MLQQAKRIAWLCLAGWKPEASKEFMTTLATLAVAFAALCVWLIVRVVNRQGRWAKWTLAAVIGLPALFGP